MRKLFILNRVSNFNYSFFLELVISIVASPYLRTDNCKIQPVLNSEINFNYVDFIASSKSILQTHADELLEYLTVVDNKGLLEWGQADSKIKHLLQEFK